MAGIGFELKRLFRRKGLFATMRAYGYAGIVCTGPMLLGVLLQVGILVLCGQPRSAGVHGDLYAAGVAHAHEFFLYAGHALFGRYAFCRARG